MYLHGIRLPRRRPKQQKRTLRQQKAQDVHSSTHCDDHGPRQGHCQNGSQIVRFEESGLTSSLDIHNLHFPPSSSLDEWYGRTCSAEALTNQYQLYRRFCYVFWADYNRLWTKAHRRDNLQRLAKQLAKAQGCGHDHVLGKLTSFVTYGNQWIRLMGLIDDGILLELLDALPSTKYVRSD